MFTLILRLAVLAVGLFFALLLLALGLVFTIVIVVWSLLRGRRPKAVRFRVDPRSPFSAMRRGGAANAHADVVDIEAREVPDAPTHLPRE